MATSNMASTGNIALPGQSLSSTDKADLGPGVHIDSKTSTLCASISGPILTKQPSTSKSLPSILVQRPNTQTGSLLPEVGTTVLGRVTRTNRQQANISILSLIPSGSNTPTTVNDPFPALLRLQDIRLTELDKVSVPASFRVGDIVRATVISLGDERAYYLSTARNDLGVLMATSEAGNQMVPVNWKEFLDPVTGAKEGRKVARPV